MAASPATAREQPLRAARDVTVIVTLPPSDWRIQPLIGSVAVPCTVTTAVAPSVVPVCGTTDHAVMPGGFGTRARWLAAASATDSSVRASVSSTPVS